MNVRLMIAAAVLGFVWPAHASEPGKPLDCSDWVLVVPGLECRQTDREENTFYGFHRSVLKADDQDPESRVRWRFSVDGPNSTTALCGTATLRELEVYRRDAETLAVETVGTLRERCVSDAGPLIDGFANERPITRFDHINGVALIHTRAECRSAEEIGGAGCRYQKKPLVWRITGLHAAVKVKQDDAPPDSEFRQVAVPAWRAKLVTEVGVDYDEGFSVERQTRTLSANLVSDLARESIEGICRGAIVEDVSQPHDAVLTIRVRGSVLRKSYTDMPGRTIREGIVYGYSRVKGTIRLDFPDRRSVKSRFSGRASTPSSLDRYEISRYRSPDTVAAMALNKSLVPKLERLLSESGCRGR